MITKRAYPGSHEALVPRLRALKPEARREVPFTAKRRMHRPRAMYALLWLLQCNGELPPLPVLAGSVHHDDDDALAKVRAAKAKLARSCNEQMTKRTQGTAARSSHC